MTTSANNDSWWTEYPLNLDSYDPIRCDGARIRDRLSDASIGCFLPEINNAARPDPRAAGGEAVQGNGRAISLRVVDIFLDQNLDSATAVPNLCSTEREAEAFMAGPSWLDSERSANHRVRIISIHSDKTTGPLLITSRLARKLLATYKVPPEFLQLLLAFKWNEELSENANNNFYEEQSTEGSKKTLYEIRYMEPSGRPDNNLVERHTGVYHEHDPKAKFDLFILLQSKKENTAEQRICALKEPGPNGNNHSKLADLCDHPFKLHTLLLSSYILNWRPYLELLARESSEKGDPAMVLTPGKDLNFELVQELRSTQDKVILANKSCKTSHVVITRLMNLHQQSLKGLKFFETQLESFVDSSEMLLRKNRNAIELIDFMLDRSIQEDTAKVYEELKEHTKHVHYLTKDSVKNNTTVKVITFVSAFYLPGSFVATFFGMNFIGVNLSKTQITVTNDLWIYFLLWLVLSLGTFGVYRLFSTIEDKRVESRIGPVDPTGSRVEKGR